MSSNSISTRSFSHVSLVDPRCSRPRSGVGNRAVPAGRLRARSRKARKGQPHGITQCVRCWLEGVHGGADAGRRRRRQLGADFIGRSSRSVASQQGALRNGRCRRTKGWRSGLRKSSALVGRASGASGVTAQLGRFRRLDHRPARLEKPMLPRPASAWGSAFGVSVNPQRPDATYARPLGRPAR